MNNCTILYWYQNLKTMRFGGDWTSHSLSENKTIDAYKVGPGSSYNWGVITPTFVGWNTPGKPIFNATLQGMNDPNHFQVLEGPLPTRNLHQAIPGSTNPHTWQRPGQVRWLLFSWATLKKNTTHTHTHTRDIYIQTFWLVHRDLL